MAKGNISFDNGKWWRDNGDGTATRVAAPKKRKLENPSVPPSKRVKNQRGGINTRTVMAPLTGGVVMSKTIVPRFQMNGAGTLVKNTERVSSVTLDATGAFAAFNNALIPSLPGWLAQLSDLYSKYRWRTLRIIWIPKCSTATSGTVGMAVTYDRQDALPTSLDQLSQTNRAILYPPYAGYGGASLLNSRTPSGESIYIDVDISRFEKTWYNVIQTGTLTALATAVQTMYVPATLQVVSDDGPTVVGGTPAGDIYFQYEIEFIEPINPAMNV